MPSDFPPSHRANIWISFGVSSLGNCTDNSNKLVWIDLSTEQSNQTPNCNYLIPVLGLPPSYICQSPTCDENWSPVRNALGIKTTEAGERSQLKKKNNSKQQILCTSDIRKKTSDKTYWEKRQTAARVKKNDVSAMTDKSIPNGSAPHR